MQLFSLLICNYLVFYILYAIILICLARIGLLVFPLSGPIGISMAPEIMSLNIVIMTLG